MGHARVAFFEELGWTQNLNHLRLDDRTDTDSMDPYAVGRVGTVLLRDLDAIDRIDTAFDNITHTVDVRPIQQVEGWYNIQNVGFFLWRLQSFFIQEVIPRRSPSFSDGFYFSPLGNPAPLFVNPRPAPLGDKLVTETQVQSPIRKVAFYFRPEDYYENPALSASPVSRSIAAPRPIRPTSSLWPTLSVAILPIGYLPSPAELPWMWNTDALPSLPAKSPKKVSPSRTPMVSAARWAAVRTTDAE